MFHVLGVVGLVLSSATIGVEQATVEVTAIAASGEKQKDKAPELDEGCKKFSEALKAFNYAQYKTSGSATKTIALKDSAELEFGNYKVKILVREVGDDKVKLIYVVRRGKEDVARCTITLVPGGDAQVVQVDEGNNKATFFAIRIVKGG